MNFHILTLFPEMVMRALSESVIGRAAENGILSVAAADIRDYTLDKHGKTDDYPYGGGAGMLMQAQPVYDAWRAVTDAVGRPVRTVYLTPQGEVFHQAMAESFAKEEDVILLCGHYEGIDERVLTEIVTDYVSIGDFVLTGGELAAMVFVDAVGRLVPGVLNNGMSAENESFHGHLLEYPQYTRPAEWRGRKVPGILLSGDRRKIDAWRVKEAEERTKERRPDLYRRYRALEDCREILLRRKLQHTDMTELIARGQAELICAQGENICLKDTMSGTCFHTATDIENGCAMIETVLAREKERAGKDGASREFLLVLHQDFMVEAARERFGAELLMACYQAVHTRREKLPVSGLYDAAGRREEDRPAIRTLLPCHLDVVARYYRIMDDPDENLAYLKERIGKGQMSGLFQGENLAGFVGTHIEGSLGMLTVRKEYRGRKFGKALEIHAVNQALENGFTPYCQIEENNMVSVRLQQSLGLCFSKQKIYWMTAKV